MGAKNIPLELAMLLWPTKLNPKITFFIELL